MEYEEHEQSAMNLSLYPRSRVDSLGTFRLRYEHKIEKKEKNRHTGQILKFRSAVFIDCCPDIDIEIEQIEPLSVLAGAL